MIFVFAVIANVPPFETIDAGFGMRDRLCDGWADMILPAANKAMSKVSLMGRTFFGSFRSLTR